MRTFALFLLVSFAGPLNSSSVFANQNPKVGDQITFQGQLVHLGKTKYFEWNKRIESVNADESMFLVKWHTDQRDDEIWLLKEALLYIKNLPTFCKNVSGFDWSGKLERVQTPAGDFTACRIERPNYQAWYSNEIPFGLVKEVQVFDNGDTLEQAVSQFNW